MARQQEHLSRIHKLEASLEPLREELAGFRKRAHDWEMRYDTSTEEMGKLQGRIVELEGLRQKLHAQEQQLQTWDRRFSSAVNEKDGEILRLGVELSRLRGQLPRFQIDAPAKPKARTRKSAKESTSNSEFDDLKLIFGIGPVLEKRLHEYGVKWFKQLAQWSKEDILAFETHLPEFQNRVERDKWVAGAKEEHFKKYGETL